MGSGGHIKWNCAKSPYFLGPAVSQSGVFCQNDEKLFLDSLLLEQSEGREAGGRYGSNPNVLINKRMQITTRREGSKAYGRYLPLIKNPSTTCLSITA